MKAAVVSLDYSHYPALRRCYEEVFRSTTPIPNRKAFLNSEEQRYKLLQHRCRAYISYLRSYPYRCSRIQVGAILSGNSKIAAFILVEFYEANDAFTIKRSAHISDIILSTHEDRPNQRRKLITWARKQAQDWGAVTLTISSGSQFWMDKGRGEIVQTKLYTLGQSKSFKSVIFPKNISVKKARKSELYIVARFMKRLFIETSSELPQFNFPRLKEDALITYLSDSSNRALKEDVLIVLRADRPIGFVQYQVQWRDIETFSRNCVVLNNIYLLPAERNKGIGTALVNRIERNSSRKNISLLRLSATAPSFYKGMGFEVWDVIRRIY